ncbi:Mu transposase C-terminal domain-containing protein [Paenibacillus sp. TAB 01]|uniref:Mu transposase C-terminal domain-containing protein n=1 Tax=Paenibacillus sp. TAB 01 TaxID=3368988 RepID=UPI0037511777
MIKERLLIASQARVTAKGIYFRGLYYSCTRALREQWFEKATHKKSWKITIYYEPGQSEGIYIWDSERGFEFCNPVMPQNTWSHYQLQRYYESLQKLKLLKKQKFVNKKRRNVYKKKDILWKS